jgi:acyl carrier protein
MARDDVARLVCEQLAEILDIDADVITLDARVREDLDADDYAVLDLVDAVETELGERSVGFSISDDDLADVETVADVVDVVCARLGPAGENGP